MSRAVELAKKCGFPDWWLNPPEPERQNGDAKRMVEGLYHAARAEAMREAMNECAAQLVRLSKMPDEKWPDVQIAIAEIGHTIRAMADREGK